MPISYTRLRVKLTLQPGNGEAVVQESIGVCHRSIAEIPGLGKTGIPGSSCFGTDSTERLSWQKLLLFVRVATRGSMSAE